VFARSPGRECNASLDEYECHRIVIKDPPFGLVASIRWRLPEPPAPSPAGRRKEVGRVDQGG